MGGGHAQGVGGSGKEGQPQREGEGDKDGGKEGRGGPSNSTPPHNSNTRGTTDKRGGPRVGPNEPGKGKDTNLHPTGTTSTPPTGAAARPTPPSTATPTLTSQSGDRHNHHSAERGDLPSCHTRSGTTWYHQAHRDPHPTGGGHHAHPSSQGNTSMHEQSGRPSPTQVI